MKHETKRKWRWSSKSPFSSSQPKKRLVVNQSMVDNQDSAPDGFIVNEMSLDGCSTEDGHERSGMAARIRRHGSRFLSIVGLQRSSGMCYLLVDLLKRPLNAARHPQHQTFIKCLKRARYCSSYRQGCCNLVDLDGIA